MSLIEREPAQVLDKISVERRAVFVELLDELRCAETQRVTRLSLNGREKARETIGDVFVNFKSDVSVDGDEVGQLFFAHRVVIRMEFEIQRLNAVHRHATGPKHAFDLLQHRVFLIESDVPEDVETDDIIKRRAWKDRK